MRVSTYHKAQGSIVERYSPLLHQDYDKIYTFSLFDYTPKHYVRKDMLKGGTGFDLTTKLPKVIEDADYDWSLYPNCDYSLIWFSNGCIRNCPFCVVRKKEGYIRPLSPKNLNPNGKYIKVMDNNFFANPEWRTAAKQLRAWKQPLEFQGIDGRLLDEGMCNALNIFKHYKQIKIAWDNPKEDLLPQLEQIVKWINPYKLMCYVLIGFWSTPEEDLYRVEELRKLKIDPFIMPFDRSDLYQRAFARWVNRKAIFKSVKWDKYNKTLHRGTKEIQTFGCPFCDDLKKRNENE